MHRDAPKRIATHPNHQNAPKRTETHYNALKLTRTHPNHQNAPKRTHTPRHDQNAPNMHRNAAASIPTLDFQLNVRGRLIGSSIPRHPADA